MIILNIKLNTSYINNIEYDRKFNEGFRGKLSKEFIRGYEWKYIVNVKPCASH